jgi:N-acetylglucosamine-6-phosphate deacetylase
VSDAAPLAGLPEGKYEWEHKPVFVKGGTCRLGDGTIAGAHSLLDTGVRNMVSVVGLSLEQALIPATSSSAGCVRLGWKGRLRPGYDADLVALNDELHPVMTFVKGELLWADADYS